MSSYTIFLIFLKHFFGVSTAAAIKPYNLSMLVTLVQTGDEPRTGVACMAGVQVAVEAFNKRRDILSSYNIVPDFKDEGQGALLLTTRVFEFLRQFEPDQSTPASYPAPITLGPWYSAGCGSYAQTTKYLNLVQLTFGCNSGSYIQRRDLYPNTYRSASSAYLLAYPYVKFISEVGRWNRLAIVTYADNSFDYTLAIRIQEEAKRNNITVIHFDIIHDVSDHTVSSLLASDPRIIDFQVAVPPIIVRFLCLAFKHGLTGPKYTIMLLYESYFEAKNLEEKIGPDCNRKIVEEQLRYCIWTGWQPADTELHSKLTSAGYNYAYFESRFFQITKGERPADYGQRLFCHDTAVKGILALDNAEKVLNLQNRTLRDFLNEPELIMKVVNKSVVQSQFDGLRLKNFSYDPVTLEMDAVEVQAISRWTKETDLVFHYRSKIRPGSDPFQLSNHYFEELTPFKWFTLNGKPQNDRSVVVDLIEDVPQQLFLTFLTGAILLSLVQISITAVIGMEINQMCVNCNSNFEIGIPHQPTYFVILMNLLLLNASSILFLSNPSQEICILRIATLALACGFLQSFIFVGIKTLCEVLPPDHNKGHELNQVAPTIISRQISRPISQSHYNKAKLISKPGSVVSIFYRFCPWPILSTSILLVSWFSSESFYVVVKYNQQSLAYHEIEDFYERQSSFDCESLNEVTWSLAIVSLHLLCLIVEIALLYTLSRRPWLHNNTQLKALRLVTLNTATLVLGAILLLVVLKSFTAKRIMISVVALVLSICISLSFSPLLAKLISHNKNPTTEACSHHLRNSSTSMVK